MMYGSFDIPRANDKPLNFVVLRVPPKGVPWRKITQAINRLVKTFYPVGTRASDRYCNLDGDVTQEHGAKLGARLYEWFDGDLRLVDTAREAQESQS
jgi:hypothetical protein